MSEQKPGQPRRPKLSGHYPVLFRVQAQQHDRLLAGALGSVGFYDRLELREKAQLDRPGPLREGVEAILDWTEHTSFSNEVAEMTLAHMIGDNVEAAYRRSDLFGKRCALIEALGKLACQICARTEIADPGHAQHLQQETFLL